MDPLWSRDLLVGAKKQFVCATGPASGGEAFPEVYSGLATADLTLWPCALGIPMASWQAFAT